MATSDPTIVSPHLAKVALELHASARAAKAESERKRREARRLMTAFTALKTLCESEGITVEVTDKSEGGGHHGRRSEPAAT